MTSSTFEGTGVQPSILFLHAHPDDESIFTGGTIARLTDAGFDVTVVIATDDDTGSSGVHRRRLEAEAAAAELKISRVEFLGYQDSGLAGTPGPGSFAVAPLDEVAERVAGIAKEVGATAIVGYEPGGIYGHADHLAVHRVGRRSAELAGVATVYEATVDREHLHFVATHVVGDAIEALLRETGMGKPTAGRVASIDGKLAGGSPTVLIDTVVDVSSVVDRKRAAMAAHTSQLPPDADVMQLDTATFTAVYGHEWYVRLGPPGALDRLVDGDSRHERSPN